MIIVYIAGFYSETGITDLCLLILTRFLTYLFKHHSGIEDQWKSGWDTLCLLVLAKHADTKIDVLLVFQHHSWTSDLEAIRQVTITTLECTELSHKEM